LPKTFPTTFFYFINYNIIIVQVRCITTESKEAVRIGNNGFPFTAFVLSPKDRST